MGQIFKVLIFLVNNTSLVVKTGYFIWEKSEKSYDWIWRNWPKWPFLGQNDNLLPFLGQKGEIEIFREEIFLAIFFKTKKLVSMRKIRKILWPDLEKLVKIDVFGPKWPFLDCFLAKMAKTRFFRQNQKNVTSVHSWSCNFVQETRKILWADSEI